MRGNKHYLDVKAEPRHKEILKNHSIRVYQVILSPGEQTEFHLHNKGTIYIVIKGGKISTHKLSGSGRCPTHISHKTPLIRRIQLIMRKALFLPQVLPEGFVFYMPSHRFPIIHRASSSPQNTAPMNLIGIEILNHIEINDSYTFPDSAALLKNSSFVIYKMPLLPFDEVILDDLPTNGLFVPGGDDLVFSQEGSKKRMASHPVYYFNEKESWKISNELKTKGSVYIILLEDYIDRRRRTPDLSTLRGQGLCGI